MNSNDRLLPAGNDGIGDLIDRLREEGPRIGQLAARMRFKQALVSRVGAEAAFALAVPELGVRGLDALHHRSVRPLKEVARSLHLAYRELWPGGARHRLSPLNVVGPSNHRPLTVTDRACYLACVDDVQIRGRSDVLLRGEDALIDFEGDEYDAARGNAEFDPGILAATATGVWTMEPGGEVQTIKQALMLCGARTGDFGHWVTEYFPKLAVARLRGWQGGMPVLVDKTTPDTVREALTELLPRNAPLVSVPHLAPLRVGRLWCMSDPLYFGFYPNEMATVHPAHMLAPPHYAALLQEVAHMAAAATAEPTGIDRVYLARRPERKKKLVNHAEILDLVERHGFRAVYPEDLSLLEQWRIVRHARFIVAPEGSNGLLMLFARPGARACLLSSPLTHRATGFGAILQALGVALTVVTGPCATDSPTYTEDELWSFWNDYRIDAPGFANFLQSWLKAG